MKKIRTSFPLILLILAWSTVGFTQPCLPGWEYRLPIVIDNSANAGALTNHQVLIILDTQTPIGLSKMNAAGNDLRFLNYSGTSQSHWLESGINSLSTRIWVKVSSVAALSTDTIYLFYGAPFASSTSNGSQVFELFDEFNGNVIDAAKWDTCNAGTFSVTGGTLSLSSTGATSTKAIVTSIASFSVPVITEIKVNSVALGMCYIGQITAAGQGYCCAFEDVVGVTSMRLMQINSSATCQNITNLAVNVPVQALTTTGLWEFTWSAQNEQSFDWPGAVSPVSRAGTYTRTAPLHATIGVQDKAGYLIIDNARIRKYVANEPVVSFEAEELVSVPLVAVSSNAPTCVGTNLQFTAGSVAGMNYTWTGPNGFSSTQISPSIPTVSAAADGTYTLNMTDPGGCTVRTYNVSVSIVIPAVSGVLSANDSLCNGSNDGTLRLAGYSGTILRWENSSTGAVPWNTITNTSDSLEYLNLNQTTYYRVVLNRGTCTEVKSNIVRLQVDANTVKGTLTGDATLCNGDNSGQVLQAGHVGNILSWQYSIDFGGNWNNIVSSSSTYSYTNVTTHTLLRTRIQNGVCAALFSDPVTLGIVPKPVPSFTTAGDCHGTLTTFTNTSTIASGTITSYSWDLGDGTLSNLTSPSKVFTNPGTYNINLLATSNQGCSTLVANEIHVNPIPNPDFLAGNLCEGDLTQFTNLSSISAGAITNFTWFLNDGGASSGATNPTHTFSAGGTYNVKLIATSDSLCEDSLVQAVIIESLPVVDFVSDSVCHGLPIQFLMSTPSVFGTTYNWLFGDASSSPLQSPMHTYADTGNYTVHFSATSGTGCVGFITKNARIYPLPQVDFMVENHCLNEPAAFTNLSSISIGTLTHQWSFGDGSMSTTTNPFHTYPGPAIYNVGLTSTSQNGCSVSISEPVEVYYLPSANFVFGDVCQSTAANFTNISSIVSGTMDFSWDFGDSVTVDTVVDATHLYNAPGNYSVLLIATSEDGCIDSLQKSIVIHPDPKASFSVESICDGVPAAFINLSTVASGSITDYSWDFGDGKNSIVQTPSHQYLNVGTYNVLLEVTTDMNCTDDTVLSVEVYELPVAEFSVDDVCFGNANYFVNSSAIGSGQLSYSWTLGDATTSTLPDPDKIYDAPGLYEVRLTATSNNGCKDSRSKGVIVWATPVVIAPPVEPIFKGGTIALNATGATEYVWTPYEVLNNSLVASPLATLLETTLFVVTGTDEYGCVASDTILVEVEENYHVVPANVLTPNGNGENDTWFVRYLDAYTNNKVTVLDRWGYTVFEQSNYQNDWNAASGTDILPDGTYYYIINFDGTDVQYNGTLTILRDR